MLTLVEPIMLHGFEDRPNLGCAMLIAACEEQGINTTLIKGQTRFLGDIFKRDRDELWGLIQDLTAEDLAQVGIPRQIKAVQEMGLAEFTTRFDDLYDRLVVNKNPRHYLNGKLVEEFTKFFMISSAVYGYYVENRRYEKLRIIERYVAEILESNPRYLGFSLQGLREPVSRVVRRRLKELTGVPLILGGSQTLPLMLEPEKLKKFFQEDPVDYLVLGPGEEALPRLLQRLEEKQTAAGIANVIYRCAGEPVSGRFEVISDLDRLPLPDFRQFDLDRYLSLERVLPLQDARGCPWKKCAFCECNSISLGSYRTFSVMRLLETINHLRETYSCRHFIFHGNGLPATRARQLSDAILQENLGGLALGTLARLNRQYDNANFLTHLRKAGFVTMSWGLESGSQAVLKAMDKGTEVSRNSRILQKSCRAGIFNLCFVMFGFPGETREDAQKTVDFLRAHAGYIDQVNHGLFSPCPGSLLWENPGRWGVELDEDGSCKTWTGMPEEELVVFYQKFLKQLETNSLKISTGRINNKPTGSELECLYLQCASHRLLISGEILESIAQKELARIFPVILGEIKTDQEHTAWAPVDSGETVFINLNLPEPWVFLDEIQREIYAASDGSRSMKDILEALRERYRDAGEGEKAWERGLDFYATVFAQNWGLAFGEPWGTFRSVRICHPFPSGLPAPDR
jgi:radical SAM superfamily enzyme YgiQ (UPF0313 family)